MPLAWSKDAMWPLSSTITVDVKDVSAIRYGIGVTHEQANSKLLQKSSASRLLH